MSTEPAVRLHFPGRERVDHLIDRVRPGRFVADRSATVGDDPSVGRIIGGEMLRSAVTLVREGVECDLIIADPPWPSPYFRYSTDWEDDPNKPTPGSSTNDLELSELDWLRFMKPRLTVLRQLLAPTGVLVLTSEHRNLFRLGQLVDEEFGVSNRLTVLGYGKAYVHRGRSGVTYDYLIVVARDRQRWLEGPGRSADIDAPQWWTPSDLADPPVVPVERGYRTAGINELTEIVGPGHRFFHAKPSSLYRKAIDTWCPADGLVLDPFAGSGAAAHAVLDLNASSGSRRRFILIDEIEDTLDGTSVVRRLTAERVRRVMSGAWHSGSRAGREGGFTFEVLA